MQGEFIYVFDTKAYDKLLSENYHLLKADKQNNIFVFINKGISSFATNNTEDLIFVLSDTLIF